MIKIMHFETVSYFSPIMIPASTQHSDARDNVFASLLKVG